MVELEIRQTEEISDMNENANYDIDDVIEMRNIIEKNWISVQSLHDWITDQSIIGNIESGGFSASLCLSDLLKKLRDAGAEQK